MDNNEKIVNAQITSTFLGREDHDILTFILHMNLSSGGCVGVGGYCLDYYDKTLKKRVFPKESMELISKILETIGVSSWEKLPNTYCRIVDPGLGGVVKKIGHLMKDQWFDIEKFFKEKKELID